MTTVYVHHRVADYIVANTFDSRQAAEALMNNATLREAMGRGGVIPYSLLELTHY
jgi:hypothetical protein